MRTFEALFGYWDDGDVWVCWDGKRVAKLDPHFEVMNKSPTGFSWGYSGSGPAQLAFALLAAVIGTERASNPYMFQRFKQEVIGQLDQHKGWIMTEEFIGKWVAKQLAEK